MMAMEALSCMLKRAVEGGFFNTMPSEGKR